MGESLMLTLSLMMVFSCKNNSTKSRTANKTAFSPQSKPTDEEIEKIAKEAYIYGYPVVYNYRFLYARCVDKNDGMYVAPINIFGHKQEVEAATARENESEKY
jgi:hypothetical protein